MIQFSTSKGRFLAVDVRMQHRYSEYRMYGTLLQGTFVNDTKWNTIGWMPNGENYAIIGIASELSEEVCAGIVDDVRSSMASVKAGYYEYENTDTVNNATASFHSLLRSHNIPNNSLILKIE